MKIGLAVSVALLLLGQAPRALACINDTDCGATCGGMVCSFEAATYQQCVAASTGDPGWCTSNAGCQCAGATCNATTHYCSYTQPVDMAGVSTTSDLATAAAPDMAKPPTTTTNSSSGCDFGGGAPVGGLGFVLALLVLGWRKRSYIR